MDRYYFDWQSKKHSYSCVLMNGKKPVCGILSGDFETVRSWVNRKKESILHNEIYGKQKIYGKLSDRQFVQGGFKMKEVEEKIIEVLKGNHGEGLKKLSRRDEAIFFCPQIIKYYLWDNLLFWNDSENIYYFSGRGWSSGTTKHRLNALLNSFTGAVIYQKNYKWFLAWNGKIYPVDPENIFYFKGSKLYKKAAQDIEVLPL